MVIYNLKSKSDFQVFNIFKNLYEDYINSSIADRKTFCDMGLYPIVERLGGSVKYKNHIIKIVDGEINLKEI